MWDLLICNIIIVVVMYVNYFGYVCDVMIGLFNKDGNRWYNIDLYLLYYLIRGFWFIKFIDNGLMF